MCPGVISVSDFVLTGGSAGSSPGGGYPDDLSLKSNSVQPPC